MTCAGDYGHFDDGGNLYIVDRLKELLKFRGFQVNSKRYSPGLDRRSQRSFFVLPRHYLLAVAACL